MALLSTFFQMFIVLGMYNFGGDLTCGPLVECEIWSFTIGSIPQIFACAAVCNSYSAGINELSLLPSYSSRFSADWIIFRECAHCVVLHCALLHLLTISSLLDDHAADTTVSGCTASSQQPWTNFLLKNRPFDRSAGRGAPHKGLNLSKRFTNLPLESMSSILNSDPKICHDARIEV